MFNEGLNELTKNVFTRVEELESIVANNRKQIQKNAEQLEKQNEKYVEIKNENQKLKEKLKECISDVSNLEESLEDKTNRQLRKTLIFSNIPEQPNESWDETRELLAKKISEASKGEMNIKTARNCIERAHRGKNNRRTSVPRPIYAAIDDWRRSEEIKEFFLRKSTSGVYCDQMYGPRTTWRRNKALAKRKELKASDKHIKAYVAFPARLMAKKPGDKKYALIDDLSKIPVVFDK